ncbi:hypothetical protein GV792_04790 [Nocardia cyriacigeorgica]|uniref:hypothetical protein n=1 Tax=Nocardia cyriacigeorgica TaxID=135487 RepID=UPI0013BB8AD4|nr:hypothetical protein [Nocardia cyriacigeorgica]NEW49360.1 hypothetical protein [Nocardia cyriacigeorgica]
MPDTRNCPPDEALDALIAACRAQLAKVTETSGADVLFDLAVIAANGLPVLLDEIDRLRARVAEQEAKHRDPEPKLLGYLPPITKPGRTLVPSEHISPVQSSISGGVAVWAQGAPASAGPLVAHAVAVGDGGDWFVDTVNLDGTHHAADCRSHAWMSDGGYRVAVVELRAVTE